MIAFLLAAALLAVCVAPFVLIALDMQRKRDETSEILEGLRRPSWRIGPTGEPARPKYPDPMIPERRPKRGAS